MTEEILKNFLILGKSKSWINSDINIWGYDKLPEADTTGDIKKYSLPFIDYILEDKSIYPKASDSIDPKTGSNYIDPDNDFLIGKSGGILMNIDFIFVNTDTFRQTAIYYDEHKRYCPYDIDDDRYIKFWDRETQRRRKGIQARCKVYFKDIEEYFNPKTNEVRKKQLRHYVRITGDHYNYINYGRIERTPTDEERIELDKQGKISVKTVPGFPRFWDADYWYYKADEFIIHNKRNNVIAKARRKGMSYKRGNQAANRVNMNKAVTVLLAADILDYLTDPEATADMVKKNLDWLETQTYWKRGYLSESLTSIELGYKKTKEGNKKYGFRSKVLSVAIGRNESAPVGKKAIDIDFEESGKSPNVQNSLNVTLSNMESGAIKIGTARVYGTAGTKGANWTPFKNIFYNPDATNMLGFENIWNRNARHSKCGMFIPQIWCCEPYIYDGNSLLLSAWKWDLEDKLWQKKNKKPQDYIMYCAQRANTPSEAFIDTKDNIFSSPALNDHIFDVQDNPEKHYYTDGWYVNVGNQVEFWNRARCEEADIFKNHGNFHEYISDVPFTDNTDIHGCVREFYPPYYENGKVVEGINFIVVDPYRIDKNIEEVTIKNSLYSIQCYARHNTKTPYSGKRLLASYCGRLDRMMENDMITLNMSKRYAAGVLVEAGTGELITNFKTWGEANRLMRDPIKLMDKTVSNKQVIPFGITIGDGETKLEGIRMLYDLLYEIISKTENGDVVYRLHEIDDIAYLLELQKFNLTENFDRISTGIIAAYEFKKDFYLLKENVESSKSSHNSIKRLSERIKKRIRV